MVLRLEGKGCFVIMIAMHGILVAGKLVDKLLSRAAKQHQQCQRHRKDTICKLLFQKKQLNTQSYD